MTNNQSKPRGECIEWTGMINPSGYGMLNIKGISIGAHRISWALASGRAPKKGMDICHKCDNRKCINPEHLFEGTRKENMQDALHKGRLVAPNRGKQFCIRGHEFTEENTYIRTSGKRACKECHRMHGRAYVARKKHD